MSFEAWLTLAIIVVLFALLMWGKWPTWAVFVLALAAILTFGLATEAEALQGFSNSGVLSVVVLFVVAAGMYRTGAITLIVQLLVGLPQSERATNLRLLPITATGSAFLNNTPIVAMLVPVIADLGRSAKLAVSKIYMPVSHASIIGGAATLIGTSTNLIIAGLVLATFDVEVDIFFPTPVGLPAAIVGIAFLVLVAGRLLGDRAADTEEASQPRVAYRTEFQIRDTSVARLSGKSLAAAGLAAPTGGRLLQLTRGDEVVETPPDGWELMNGDVITYEATIATVGNLWATLGLEAANPREVSGDEYAHRLVEGVIAAESRFVGQAISDLPPSDRKLVAISRRGQAVSTSIGETVIEAGDNMVIEAEEDFLDQEREAFSLTTEHSGYRMQRPDRAVAAGLIVAAMVLLSAFGVMSLLNAALLAAIALIATECLSFKAAFQSIDWKTFVILGCAVGLEPAVVNSGLAEVIGDTLTTLAGDNLMIALTVVFIGAVLLTNLVTNTAAAVLMFPITVAIVATLGVPWEPFVVVLMLGCSYAFINPAGYQTHLLVMQPGNYRFSDFAKVGVPLTILLGVIVVPLAALVYGP